MRKLYSVSELLSAAKAVIRGSVSGVGTEPGTDHDLTLHAAVRLLQGGQVAARHVFDQLVPETADAANRDCMVDFYGLPLEKPATPARGLLGLLIETTTAYRLPAGTDITLPETLFPDGVARTYRTLEDVDCPGTLADEVATFSVGTSIHKLRPRGETGVARFFARDVLRVVADDGASTWLGVARRINSDDQSIDLYAPVPGGFRQTTNEGIARAATGVVVPVECTELGAIGNIGPTIAPIMLEGVTEPSYAMVIEMGGGGDAVGPMDADTGRVVRLLEDTIASPPSFGNAQHWREIALSCPDVDLDDAIVYRHVRGPGTIDIVCIGRSSAYRAPGVSWDAPELRVVGSQQPSHRGDPSCTGRSVVSCTRELLRRPTRALGRVGLPRQHLRGVGLRALLLRCGPRGCAGRARRVVRT